MTTEVSKHGSDVKCEEDTHVGKCWRFFHSMKQCSTYELLLCRVAKEVHGCTAGSILACTENFFVGPRDVNKP